MFKLFKTSALYLKLRCYVVLCLFYSCRPEQLAFDKCAFAHGFDKAAVAVDVNAKVLNFF